jgi:hypothetical protein
MSVLLFKVAGQRQRTSRQWRRSSLSPQSGWPPRLLGSLTSIEPCDRGYWFRQAWHTSRRDQMKSLKWVAALGAVTVGVILYLNRDDVIRYQKMRRM